MQKSSTPATTTSSSGLLRARNERPRELSARPVRSAIILVSKPGCRTEVGWCPLFLFKGPVKEVVDEVRAIATRVAGSYGLAIFDVQFRRESGGMVLRIQIDRPGTARPEDGVSVEDC